MQEDAIIGERKIMDMQITEKQRIREGGEGGREKRENAKEREMAPSLSLPVPGLSHGSSR